MTTLSFELVQCFEMSPNIGYTGMPGRVFGTGAGGADFFVDCLYFGRSGSFILRGRRSSSSLQDGGDSTRCPPSIVRRDELSKNGDQNHFGGSRRRSSVHRPLRPTERQATSVAGPCHRVLTLRRFPFVRGLVLLHRRVVHPRLFNVTGRCHVFLQVSFRRVDQFTRHGLRTFSLASHVVKHAFVLPRLRSFKVSGPPQSCFIVRFQTLFAGRIAMVAFGGTSFRALSFFKLNFMTFVDGMFTCFRFHVVPRERGAAPRCVLPRLPGGVELIFLIVVSNCCVGVPISLFRTKVVSNDGPNAARLIHPLHRSAGLGWEIARRAQVQHASLLVLICRVLCSHLFRESALVHRVVFGPRLHDRLSNILQLITPCARNCSCCFMSSLLWRRADNNAIGATTRSSWCSFVSFFRPGSRGCVTAGVQSSSRGVGLLQAGRREYERCCFVILLGCCLLLCLFAGY